MSCSQNTTDLIELLSTATLIQILEDLTLWRNVDGYRQAVFSQLRSHELTEEEASRIEVLERIHGISNRIEALERIYGISNS